MQPQSEELCGTAVGHIFPYLSITLQMRKRPTPLNFELGLPVVQIPEWPWVERVATHTRCFLGVPRTVGTRGLRLGEVRKSLPSALALTACRSGGEVTTALGLQSCFRETCRRLWKMGWVFAVVMCQSGSRALQRDVTR